MTLTDLAHLMLERCPKTVHRTIQAILFRSISNVQCRQSVFSGENKNAEDLFPPHLFFSTEQILRECALLFAFHDILFPFSRKIEEEEDDEWRIAGKGIAEPEAYVLQAKC